jgi:flagellar basal body-associated protein FliL
MIVLLVVTLVSMLVAVIMSFVAWRVATEERRRSEARVAALAAEIHGDDFDLRPADVHATPTPTLAPTRGLFAAAQPAESSSRLATVVALGVIVVGSVATLALLLSSSSHRAANASRADHRANAISADNHSDATRVANSDTRETSVSAVPVELVALGHDRDGDQLTVRGIVRNPSSGLALERLTAVVFLFNRDGNFLASGRATVQSPTLNPGGESTFVVTVAHAADVGRYRVSFRTDDGVVPHIDRREQALARR